MRSRFSSRRVVHERDTCSKFFCRASLIERNAIPRDLDFQYQAALSLASPTSASGMMSATVLPRRKQIYDPKISNCKSLNQGGMQIGRSA